MQKLSEWAKSNNLEYHTAYDWYKKGKLPVKSEKTISGSIVVGDDIVVENSPIFSKTSKNNSPNQTSLVKPLFPSDYKPLLAGYQETKAGTNSRSNKTMTTESTNRFPNLKNGFSPFEFTSGAEGSSNLSGVSIREMVSLCQKAYYNFSIVQSVINVMVEFCASDIYFTEGSKKSRNFFTEYLKAINMYRFSEGFYLENWRSSNIFIYPMEGKLRDSDVRALAEKFDVKVPVGVSIPVKYTILNPADINLVGSSSFISNTYRKLLNPYELQNLRNPKTPQDEAMFRSLDKETQKAIKESRDGSKNIYINLDSNKIYALFYKKADYEPFAVSMIWPVLDDLELKSELKKADRAICRTIHQSILLVTVGSELKDGTININQNNIAALQEIFSNESIGLTLVSDYTTKIEFIIPQIADILDPKKYEVVNEDLKTGLNDILFSSGGSSDKFANQQGKLKAFVEKLKKARKLFLNDFLQPEIDRIGRLLNFKQIPKAATLDIDLDNPTEYDRLLVRLGEIGFLTPQQTFEALDTGKLPIKDELEEEHRKFKEAKDDGLYQSVTGGPYTQLKLAEMNQQAKIASQSLPKDNGRPKGIHTPQEKKRIGPIGGSYDLQKIKANLVLASKLEDNLIKELKKRHKIKGELSDQQKEIISELQVIIMSENDPTIWTDKIREYLDNPLPKSIDRQTKINDIAYQHQINNYIAAILINSE